MHPVSKQCVYIYTYIHIYNIYTYIRQGRLKRKDSPRRSTKNSQWFVSKNNSMDFRALNVGRHTAISWIWIEESRLEYLIWLHLHPIRWTYSTLWQEHEESYRFEGLTHHNPCGNLFMYPNLCVTAPTSPLNMFMSHVGGMLSKPFQDNPFSEENWKSWVQLTKNHKFLQRFNCRIPKSTSDHQIVECHRFNLHVHMVRLACPVVYGCTGCTPC